MSTAAGARSNGANAGVNSPEKKDKGKGKSAVVSPDVSMEEDEDEVEEEEEEEEYEDEEMEDEEDDDDDDDSPEIDTSNIQGRRTRGIKVDYTSEEALAKAGLTQKDMEEEDDKWTGD